MATTGSAVGSGSARGEQNLTELSQQKNWTRYNTILYILRNILFFAGIVINNMPCFLFYFIFKILNLKSRNPEFRHNVACFDVGLSEWHTTLYESRRTTTFVCDSVPIFVSLRLPHDTNTIFTSWKRKTCPVQYCVSDFVAKHGFIEYTTA